MRRGLVKRAEEWKGSSVREYEGVDADEPESRCGLRIDRVPLPLKSFTIEAASRLARLPADPAERDPHLGEEAADRQSRSALGACYTHRLSVIKLSSVSTSCSYVSSFSFNA